MRRAALIAAAVLLCSTAPAAVLAAAAPPAPGAGSGAATNGVIRGRVTDRTAPVHPLAGQPVRLLIVERGTSSERQTRTDAAGTFVFSGLPVGGLRVFLVSTQYGGASYESAERIVLTPETPVREAPLAVYEGGGTPARLRGGVLFAVVDAAPGALRVTTVEQVRNPGDRTVVTTAADPLVFPLPPVAVAVQPLDGWSNPRTQGGRITDTRAVTPGTVQFTYAYQERPQDGRAVVAWTPPFGAARVEILVADAGLRVAARGLQAADPVTAQGRRYAHWSGGPVAPGAAVTLDISGVPSGADRWPAALAGALAAVLAGGLAAALRVRGGRPPHANH
jgi:hypothetical protein